MSSSETDIKEDTPNSQGESSEPQILQTFCLEDGTTTIQTVADHNITEYTITQDVNKEGDVIVVTEDGQTFTLDKDSAALITQSKDGIDALIDEESSKRKSVYKCPFEGCTKHYSSQHHLKVHMRNHTGDRPFVCVVVGCSKAFTTKYGLKAHIRTHTGEKPYKCRSCEKSFKTSGDLQKHIRTHTGERPFKCNFPNCDKSFTTSNIRKVHLRTHTGERPYTCTKEGCGRTFSSATNYKNHARIHTGEKPYHCTVQDCGKRFTEYSSLYKHNVVHSGTKPYTCFMCGRHYRQTSTLVSHKKADHGIWENPNGTHIYLKDMPKKNDALVVISDEPQQTSATHILVLCDPQVLPLSEASLGTNKESSSPPTTDESKVERGKEEVLSSDVTIALLSDSSAAFDT